MNEAKALLAASLSDLPNQARTCIRVFGSDAERFLQGLLSQDLLKLEEKEARAAALLTVKGKIISELIVLPGPNEDSTPAFRLLVPASIDEEVYQALDRHIIMDDVQLQREELEVGIAFDPRTDDQGSDAQDGAGELAGFETYRCRHPAPGFLFLSASSEVSFADVARENGMSLCTVSQWDRFRIQSASPSWGTEIEANRFPNEVGFAYAVSYEKGCFRGQEPLARMHARGQVNWVMVRVSGSGFDKSSASIERPWVLKHDEREQAGRLTSFVLNEDGTASGLAIVHRSIAHAGEQCAMSDDSFSGEKLKIESEALGS